MRLQADINGPQLAEIDLTITITMKVKEWALIIESVSDEAKQKYHHTKYEFTDNVASVIQEYTDKVERTIELK